MRTDMHIDKQMDMRIGMCMDGVSIVWICGWTFERGMVSFLTGVLTWRALKSSNLAMGPGLSTLLMSDSAGLSLQGLQDYNRCSKGSSRYVGVNESTRVHESRIEYNRNGSTEELQGVHSLVGPCDQFGECFEVVRHVLDRRLLAECLLDSVEMLLLRGPLFFLWIKRRHHILALMIWKLDSGRTQEILQCGLDIKVAGEHTVSPSRSTGDSILVFAVSESDAKNEGIYREFCDRFADDVQVVHDARLVAVVLDFEADVIDCNLLRCAEDLQASIMLPSHVDVWRRRGERGGGGPPSRTRA